MSHLGEGHGSHRTCVQVIPGKKVQVEEVSRRAQVVLYTENGLMLLLCRIHGR